MLPTPVVMPDRVRVFFGSTDAEMIGRVFFIDLHPRSLKRLGPVVGPVLNPGEQGTFDAHGVVPSCILQEGPNLLRMYYVGFQRHSAEVPYTLLAGVATSVDGGCSFLKEGRGPVLPPLPEERFFRTAPWVVKEASGYKMWYIGGSNWLDHEGKRFPIYGLRFATSSDGRIWSSGTKFREPDLSSGEIGFGRPVVDHTGSQWRMFLSRRTLDGYALEQSNSQDAQTWAEYRPLHLQGQSGDWESQMQCFAHPLGSNGENYIIYNGDNFGRTGFGLAVMT